MECGPSNAIASLSKQVHSERHLDQLSFNQSHSRLQTPNTKIDEFFADSKLDLGQVMAQPEDLSMMRAPIPMSFHSSNWHQEFQHSKLNDPSASQNIIHFENSFKSSSNHQNHASIPLIDRPQIAEQRNWTMDYRSRIAAPMSNFPMHARIPQSQSQPQQNLEKEFEDAFVRAKGLDVNAVTDQWTSEFTANQETDVSIDASNSADSLAKTAGIIADIVEKSENPKFKNSKFLNLMQQFRDKEVAIEGDKVVQQIQPVSSHQMAREFMEKAGSTAPTTSWEEDFSMKSNFN